MSRLRPFQQQLKQEVYKQWANGAKGVVMQSSTGSGKTVIIGEVATDHARNPWNPRLPGGLAMAHRGELVSQISQAFAREGVSHDIIGPDKLIKNIVANHVDELGRTLYNARAIWKVASVDTIRKRSNLDAWLMSVGMVIPDEAHHVLRSNKWGKACLMAHPDARLLLPTATPCRADGKGLGSHAEGLADVLVEGPPMRWLINAGYLTDYRYFGVNPSDLNLTGVDISTTTGDFNPQQLAAAVKKSTAIVGDIVNTYCRLARGKLGITFAVDIEHGQQIADAFNAAGVPALLVSSNNTDSERYQALKKFKNREILQLVNVDLFGEGFDLPAIECVSFGRPTASWALFVQQWGRALRLMISDVLQATWGDFTDDQRLKFISESLKPVAYIFDHAANFIRHGGPADKPQVSTLDNRAKRSLGVPDGIPMRYCLELTCLKPYERIYDACPYCGSAAPAPADRSGANVLDGDVFEYTPEALAAARGEALAISKPAYIPKAAPAIAHGNIMRTHHERQRQQHYLRETINLWAGSYRDDADRINYRRFYFTFGIDILSALALGSPDAIALNKKINDDLQKRAIVNNVNTQQQEP